jgi:sugar/nucleoside kinase (ribokinase family)
LGSVFSHDIRAQGVVFHTTQPEHGPSTATSMILVTPDAQRSMNTFLGACVELGPEDVDPKLIEGAKVTYMEGYLWDPPRAKDAFRLAIRLSHEAGRKIAISRSEFLDLLNGHVDIVFANEAEVTSLFETDDFELAAARMAESGVLSVLTRSERGSVVIQGKDRVSVPAHPVRALVDSTGAGDQYAAGFLYGYTSGRDLETCARMGSIAAAEVLDHIGPRPKRKVLELFKQAGLV